MGRAIVRFSGKTEDQAAFKTPTLREKALTALYMHNGSIGSLDEVSP
jgi:cytochrome c peroxidase